MEKKLKRESRQTGMTEGRMKALQSIKELKNSGQSRLQQALQVRKYMMIIMSMNQIMTLWLMNLEMQ